MELGDRAILEHTLSSGELCVLRELASRVHERYGDQLERFVVFGSRARGDSGPDSDIDVLAVLRIPVSDEWREQDRLWALALEAERETGEWAPLSLIVMAEERLRELRHR